MPYAVGLPRKCSEEAINVRNIPAQKHRVNERENPWRNFTSSDRTDRRHQTRPYPTLSGSSRGSQLIRNIDLTSKPL